MPEATIYDFTTRRRLLVTPSAKTERERKLLAVFDVATPARQQLMLAFGKATRRDRPEKVPNGLDAALIGECDRLHAINAAIQAASVAITDESERVPVIDRLDEQWFAVRDRIFKLASPRTAEGAVAVAKAILSEGHPDSLGEAVEGGDLQSWLCRACAEFLAGQVA